VRLTRVNVTKLRIPPGKTELLVFDDNLPGFGIRLRAGGKRVWIAQYRVGRKQRRVTLGTVDILDPDEARKAARSTLAKVQLGSDPQADKTEARSRAAVTLGAVSARYLDRAKGRLKPRSYIEVERHLTRHWAPLKGLPLHQMQRVTIAARLGEIATEHGPFAANRARASLSGFFTWAMREGLADSNPVIGTNRSIDERSRERILSNSELASLWNGCREDDYGRIVRLLILTGQRREEVGGMARAELQLDRGLWSIPSERTKKASRMRCRCPSSRSKSYHAR
jgi:integrase